MNRLHILLKIRELQQTADNRYFDHGIFPSYRTNKLLNITHPDDNIFFSASTLFILNNLKKDLNNQEKRIIDNIKKDLLPNFKKYTNKPERNSYNFWQKKQNKHFPNGIFLNKLNKFKLPDDIDTTSMVQMTNNTSKPEALKTKKILQKHANLFKIKIQNGHPELREINAYSTWFGLNMPIEFDVCVLSNYLLWLNFYNFDINTNDKATIQLIEYSINNSLYFQSAFKSSPEYPTKEIILYHLARTVITTPFLNNCTAKLTNDIQHTLLNTKSEFNKMILVSSLIKLGKHDLSTTHIQLSPSLINNWWFTAGFLSVYSNNYIQKIAPFNLFHFRFYSAAFNLALYLEYKILTDNLC